MTEEMTEEMYIGRFTVVDNSENLYITVANNSNPKFTLSLNRVCFEPSYWDMGSQCDVWNENGVYYVFCA